MSQSMGQGYFKTTSDDLCTDLQNVSNISDPGYAVGFTIALYHYHGSICMTVYISRNYWCIYIFQSTGIL